MRDYSESASWLLDSRDPSVRYLTLTDLLEKPANAVEVVETRKRISGGPKAMALLMGQQENGGFGNNPYKKWSGAHWRLVSLVNLGVPADNSKGLLMADHVLGWIHGHAVRGIFPVKNGRARIHASVYGNPVGACSYFGLGKDPKVKFIVELLTRTQWMDGGWNCDPKPEAIHSSFHETLATLWGLIIYHNRTGDNEVLTAIDKASELFLIHKIFKSHRSGAIISGEFTKLRYPTYWHYNFLEAMRVLSLAGKAKDERMAEAIALLEEKCDSNGRWAVQGTYWRPPSGNDKTTAGQEIVDWGATGPNEMITLNALRVLKAAGKAFF